MHSLRNTENKFISKQVLWHFFSRTLLLWAYSLHMYYSELFVEVSTSFHRSRALWHTLFYPSLSNQLACPLIHAPSLSPASLCHVPSFLFPAVSLLLPPSCFFVLLYFFAPSLILLFCFTSSTCFLSLFHSRSIVPNSSFPTFHSRSICLNVRVLLFFLRSSRFLVFSFFFFCLLSSSFHLFGFKDSFSLVSPFLHAE